MWKLPQKRQLLSDVWALQRKGLGIPQAFGPRMIHIFQDGEREKVHLPFLIIIQSSVVIGNFYCIGYLQQGVAHWQPSH